MYQMYINTKACNNVEIASKYDVKLSNFGRLYWPDKHTLLAVDHILDKPVLYEYPVTVCYTLMRVSIWP